MEFLRYLTILGESISEIDKLAAQLISLVRHVLLRIFPVVLTKSYNRAYGKSFNKPGEIVPYRAAQTPDTTKFGDSNTAFAYYALSAILGVVTEEEIIFGAEKVLEAARSFAFS